MALINYATREINAKIVYYGPGLSGKTTNLEQIYARIKDRNKGKLITLPTQTDRTLFFDFLPMELGTLKNFRVRVHLYTVPGQVFYNSTRKMVLKGADGVVFVADSQPETASENFMSIKNLEENLAETGIRLSDIPMVLQYNKRDIPECASVGDMQNGLNKSGREHFEAVAKDGVGVMETLAGIVKAVLNDLRDRPDAHNLDMTALESGGQDRVRYIRGEFASSPADEEPEPLEEAELVEEPELVEGAELVEEAELLEAEDAEVIEDVEFAAEEAFEDADEAVIGDLEPDILPEVDEAEFGDFVPEAAAEQETPAGMSVSEAAAGLANEQLDEADLWVDAAGTGDVETGTDEVRLVPETGAYDPIAGLDIDAIGGHGRVDFDELSRDIAKAQVEAAGDEGLFAAMMSEPAEEEPGERREFSSDEVAVFSDIVSPGPASGALSGDMGLDDESGFPMVDLSADEVTPVRAGHARPVPFGQAESFRINQSFNLPVRISTSEGQKEISLKFDLSIEVQGDGVGQDIGIEILPPRPEGRPELALGHPPPE